MADVPAFALACEVLESETSLDRLEARGTVRLALREAGLDGASVTPEQLRVVVEKILPAELAKRGVGESSRTCDRLCEALGRLDSPDPEDAPEAMFTRLGRS